MLDVQPRLLERAQEIAGGRSALRNVLRASESELRSWMESRAKLPDGVFLKVVDLIYQDDVARAVQDRRRAPRANASLLSPG